MISTLTNYQQLVIALIQPFNELEAVFQSILTMRTIYNATGWLLDDVGGLVGQPRNGLDDDTYRLYIFAKVATNISTGRRSDLINICNCVFQGTSALAHVIGEGVASTTVRIEGDYVPSLAAADALIVFLRAGAAAGVRIVLETATAPDDESFTFGVQDFTTGAISAGQTSITVTSTVGFPTVGSLLLDAGLAVAETVTYTGISGNTFTGIPASSTGSIANSHVMSSEVQSVQASPGLGFGLQTYETSGSSPGDTSIAVTSTAGFPSSGSLILDSGLAVQETVTYTGLSGGNTFTGVPASGVGSIANSHVVNSQVQDADPTVGGAFADARD